MVTEQFEASLAVSCEVQGELSLYLRLALYCWQVIERSLLNTVQYSLIQLNMFIHCTRSTNLAAIYLLASICLLAASSAGAQNFLSPSRNIASANQNALGFGYFNEPIVYKYKDGSKEDYLSNYSGWLIKYVRYFDSTSALQAHYLQAHGEEDIRELSGSAVYGFNLNRPGIGAYIGISYTLKQRTQFAGVQRINNEKDYGWDFPLGIQVQNNAFTFSLETRYKHFILQGDNVDANSERYPLYFSVLLNF